MCFIIAMLGFVFAYNFFMAGKMLLAIGSVVVSLFFIVLMIKNILHVKKIREKKDDN
jgi:hypothetical protein